MHKHYKYLHGLISDMWESACIPEMHAHEDSFMLINLLDFFAYFPIFNLEVRKEQENIYL